MFGYATVLEKLTAIERRLKTMDSRLYAIDEQLMELFGMQRRIWFAVNRPHGLDVTCYEEDSMIRFGITLPVRPAEDADWNEIANGRLVVTIPDKDVIEVITEKDDQLSATRLLESDEFVGEQGDPCKAVFNYIDNAGNHGSPVELEFTLVDTVPPVGPLALGAVMLEETPDPAPEPEPTPLPEPIPDPEPTPDTPPVVDGEAIE